MGAPSFFHRNWVWVSPERSFFHRHFDRDAFSPKMGFTPAEMVLVPTRFRAKIAELDFFPPKRLFTHRNFDPKVLIRTLRRRLPSALAKGRKDLTPLVFLAAKGVGHNGVLSSSCRITSNNSSTPGRQNNLGY